MRDDPIFHKPTAWFVAQALDVDKMRAAAKVLEGSHDFAAFRNASTDDVRDVN